MSQKRQPRGVPTGGEFAANQHDESTVALASAPYAPHAPAIPAALQRDAEIVGAPFQDVNTPGGFWGAPAKVLGTTSVYYFDESSKIVGRAEIDGGRTSHYRGDRVKGGELVTSTEDIFEGAAMSAIQNSPGGDKRPGFSGADHRLLKERDTLASGLFSDRISDAALIGGVQNGQLSRGVPGKDSVAELNAWRGASRSNPEFNGGIEDAVYDLYFDTPVADIPRKRPGNAGLARWAKSVESTGEVTAARRRGRLVAAAVLSGQSKWWKLRDNPRAVIDD